MMTMGKNDEPRLQRELPDFSLLQHHNQNTMDWDGC